MNYKCQNDFTVLIKGDVIIANSNINYNHEKFY